MRWVAFACGGGLAVAVLASSPAERSFQQAVKLQQSAATAAQPQASLEQAEKLYREAARLAPKSGAVHNNLAQLYAKQGREPEAEREFQQAIAIGGKNQGLYALNFAEFEMRRKRFESACMHYAMAAASQPDEPRLHDMLVDACLQGAPQLLAGYLWEMISDGRTHQALRGALNGLSRNVTPDEMMAIVAVALSRQHYDPAAFAELDVFRELNRGASDAGMAAAVEELQRLHRAEPGEPLSMRWWADRRVPPRPPGTWWQGGTPPPRFTRWEACQELAISLGRRYEEKQEDERAVRIYQAVLFVDDRLPNPALLLPLVEVYFRRDRAAELEELVRRHGDAIYLGKGQTIRSGQRKKEFEFHAALGLIYYKLGQWGDERDVTSAIFQLSQAVRLTGWQPRNENPAEPVLTPRLVTLLADAHAQAGRPEMAVQVRKRGAAAFRDAGDEIAAHAVSPKG